MNPQDAKWQIVGDYFSRDAGKCNECPYQRTYTQHHPYGMGTAAETIYECRLGDKASDLPEDCPGFPQEEDE